MHFWIVLPCCIHHVRYICICIYTSCISVLSRFLICHTLVWTITELCHTSLSTIYWHVFRCCLLSLIFRVYHFILTWSETTACCGKFLVLRSTLFPTTVSWPDYSYHSSVERFWWFPVDITDKHKHFLLLSCCNITGCCRARSCKCTYIRVRSFSHFFWSSER